MIDLLLAGILFFKSSIPGPGVAHVQSASDVSVCDGSAALTTVSKTFTSTVSAGSAIVVVFTAGNAVCDFNATPNANTAVVTDSLGNVYQQGSDNNLTYSTHNACGGVQYAINSGAGANTVTVTFGTAASYRGVSIHEYSGVQTTATCVGGTNPGVSCASGGAACAGGGTCSAGDGFNSVVAEAGVGGPSTAWSSPSITTTSNGDLIYGFGLKTSGTAGTAGVVGTGFSERTDVNNSCGTLYAEDEIQSSAGAVVADGTWDNSVEWIGFVLALKAQ